MQAEEIPVRGRAPFGDNYWKNTAVKKEPEEISIPIQKAVSAHSKTLQKMLLPEVHFGSGRSYTGSRNC